MRVEIWDRGDPKEVAAAFELRKSWVMLEKSLNLVGDINKGRELANCVYGSGDYGTDSYVTSSYRMCFQRSPWPGPLLGFS